MKSPRSLSVLLFLALQGVVVVAIPARPYPVTSKRNLNGRHALGFAKGDLHLINCEPRNLNNSEPVSTTQQQQQWLSLVIYCENKTDCSDPNHVPAERDMCVKKASNVSGDYQRWENSEWQTCRFAADADADDAEKGRSFSWVIVRLARLFPSGTEVGLGEDGEKRDYTAFNDDESPAAGPATHSCSKLFYLTLDDPETAPPSIKGVID